MIKTYIYWIKNESLPQVGTMPRPRGGEWLADEIVALRTENVNAVLSLLEDHEIRELELEGSRDECAAAGIDYYRLPIPDRGLPDGHGAVYRLLQDVLDRRPARIVVHCRQGIGRASIIAAALLVLGGMAPDEALARIEKARGRPVPDTAEQRDWVLRFEIYRDARNSQAAIW